MAKKKSKQNKAYKEANKQFKKYAKKDPKIAFIIISLALVVFAVIGVIIFIQNNQKKDPPPAEDSMSMTFLELGNKNNGDSIFIKVKDIDILIDAGSKRSSSKTLAEYIDQHCTDKKLEYVIVTHAHEDHIAGFVGTSKEGEEGLLKRYSVDTLIDFSKHNTDSQLYHDYVNLVNEQVEAGKIKHHYTALDCINKTNGAQKEYTLAEGISMEILDQKYYVDKASSENDYSVCTLFKQGPAKYLFTGDLEKSGEVSLLERNPSLGKVNLFKAGHHGSSTANSETFLDVIKPDVVCISCDAGYNEYHSSEENIFPSQAAINSIGRYTDKIYVTTQYDSDNDKGVSMNGTITYKSLDGTSYELICSNNNTILKDTNWFKNNRSWPTK